MRININIPATTMNDSGQEVKSVAVLNKIPAFFSNIFGKKTIQCNVQKAGEDKVKVREISMGSLLKATGKESSFSKSQVRQLASIVKHNLATDQQPPNIDELVQFLSLDSKYLEKLLTAKDLDIEPEIFQNLVDLVKNEDIKPEIFKSLIDAIENKEVQPTCFNIIVSRLEWHSGLEVEELDELEWFFDLAQASKSTEDFEYILDLFLYDETLSPAKDELLYDALILEKVPYDKFIIILMGYNGKFDQITDENLEKILKFAKHKPHLDQDLFESVVDSHWEEKSYKHLFRLMNKSIFDEGMDFVKWFMVKEFIESAIEYDRADDMTEDALQALIESAKDASISIGKQQILCMNALQD